MSEEKYSAFVNGLSEHYPKQYRNVYCEISIGEGWYHIIRALSANIDSHVKWKRGQRARDLLRNRAYRRGRDAVLKYLCPNDNASDWQEARADEIMREGPKEPTAKVEHVEIHQIKEKFGELRFYYAGGDEQVHGMVRMAECWAAYTCETCGERGQLRHGGWVRTLCDKHEAEYQAKRNNYD